MTTRNRILELLEKHRGENISGERLAEMLSVSRNAVWKAIRELRREGYHIEAATNKGYCLSDDNDILSVQGIKPFLSQDSRIYAEKIHVYQSLESTNKTAKEMAIAGAEHGTVVISDCQTSGRGRYSREFFSPSGGLYISIVLHPEALCFQNITTITAFAAVSVCEAIELISGRKPMIKWVNDIFIDGKKGCGILTEAVTDFESGHLQWIVLGMGMNVHIPAEDFPRKLQSIATSIYPQEGVAGARNRLAAEMINRILGYSVLPKEQDILAAYKKRLMMLGKEVTVIQGQSAYKAKAMDVDSAGHLIVEDENGEIHSLYSGEIRVQM
ncbi:MAG: biotin--[acetyl-CoA-carboxylase] ligase [Roseburia sp.]|nr:biotin--[acetyl-CoA-carboxylase] ligase [Roseburia sp.]